MKKILLMTLVGIMTFMSVACGKKEEVKPAVELSAVVDAVKEAYGEDYLPDAEVDAQMLGSTYGITEDMYEEAYAQIPMISVNVDTLIAVKCKDGKQQEVVDALTKYQDYLKNDALQYPTNAVKVQASRIIEKEGYVFFVMLGTIPMDVEEQGDEAILKKAEENNDIAQKAIDTFF
ncbi:MAG: DUF4358 domain-containing protein [Lachnospiraceae bacterium]|nr:DUF4358 domain-containing protein [Lachnospiraceae bacterium]